MILNLTLSNLFYKYRLTISNAMLSNPAEISRITTEKLEIKYVISKALEEQKNENKI